MKNIDRHCQIPRMYGLKKFVYIVIASVAFTTLFLINFDDYILEKRGVFPKPSLKRSYISVVVFHGARLGNLMFQYASLLGISHKLNKTAVFEDNDFINSFNTTMLKGFVKNRLGIYSQYEEFGRRASSMDKHVYELTSRNILLKGYWQSWKYFDYLEKTIRSEFTFVGEVENTVNKFINKIKKLFPNHTLIGIHIRRGDMLSKRNREYGYTTAKTTYIYKSIAFMENKLKKNNKNVVYILASDDIKWCKNNLETNRTIIFSPFVKPILDMALLSKCQHTIITVGSFGWWCAWLANGITTYYSNWPGKGSQLEYFTEKSDYFPKNWVAIDD